MGDPLTALLARWREEVEVLARTGHEDHARDVERRIEALEDALRRRRREAWMGTGEAVAYTGYSADHLRALAAEEKVVAEKAGGAWRVLRDSLPRKPRPETGGEEQPS
jgi:hypothetical protein